METKSQETEPQGPTKYEKHAKLSTKGGKVERQVLQWNPRASERKRKSQKGLRNCFKKHENVQQGAEKHTSTHKQKQPTNQGNKEQNKQTNEQTPAYTFTQTNTSTTRPLESSFEPQTQAQTPAAGCSEGDVDLAPGSPKKPFRLYVEVLGQFNNELYE